MTQDTIKFTEKQINEIRNIENISELLSLFKRIIYISNISYVKLNHDMAPEFVNMIEDMLQ